MSQAIEMLLHRSERLPGVMVLKVKGVIDSETAPVYEKRLEALLADKIYRLLVDLTEVEYISSAGVGVFIGMLQQFRDHEDQAGDLKACGVSKKIMKVFESIGLDSMMDMLEHEQDLQVWSAEAQIKEAMHHFKVSAASQEIYAGEEFELACAAQDEHQAVVADYNDQIRLNVSSGMIFPREAAGFHGGRWHGKVAVSGASGRVVLTVSDGKHAGSLEIELKEKQEGRARFPIKVSCATCGTEITVKAPDIYRCEECDETFSVDEWGRTFTIKSGSTAKRRKSQYKGMELKINADVNYLPVIRKVIEGLCDKEGMDEVTTNAVALAIDEILLNLIEHGNDFDPWQIFRIKMDFQKKQVKIQIRDYGDPFDVTQQKNISIKNRAIQGSKRGVGGFMVNQLMDSVKYESLSTYNQLTMVKRYGEAGDE